MSGLGIFGDPGSTSLLQMRKRARKKLEFICDNMEKITDNVDIIARWNDGRDFIWLNFIYDENGLEEDSCVFKTNQTSVPWRGIVGYTNVFMNIVEDHVREKLNAAIITDRTKGAIFDTQSLVPYMMTWTDYDSNDADADFRCCSYREWQDTMSFRNGYLEKQIDDFHDDAYQKSFLVAAIDDNGSEITPNCFECENLGHFENVVLEKILSGYSPLIMWALTNIEETKVHFTYYLIKHT